MELHLDADMPITEIAAGLMLVAALSWHAALIAMLVILAVIGRVMGNPVSYV